MTSVIDTSVLYGNANQEDALHGPASEVVHAIDHGEDTDVRVTNYLLEELLDLSLVHLGQGTAIEILDRLQESAHFEIDHATRSDFTDAETLFREDHQLSFVDATVITYMDREGIDVIYSFDDGFDPYGDRRESV